MRKIEFKAEELCKMVEMVDVARFDGKEWGEKREFKGETALKRLSLAVSRHFANCTFIYKSNKEGWVALQS